MAGMGLPLHSYIIVLLIAMQRVWSHWLKCSREKINLSC